MTAMLDTPRPSLDAGDSPPLPGEPHGDGQARKFRPDIEGVRALAVLLVVLYHAHLLGITGGYIGVDVFFVLSGFLITRQLVAGVDRRGIRELPSFYGRRIKRLLPASTTVVVATVIASYLWAPALQVKSITTDAIYTTFYGLNYHLAATGTDYLHQGAAPSPLQHFWSLGVEEQFYLAWPLLIVACLLLPLRVRYGALLLLLSSIAAVSFWYSATTTMSEPSWAYFSIHTRAWELAAGGLIALTSPLWTRLPSIVSNLMAWAAFGAIVASAWILTDATQYPGTAAAVPVLATAAILAAGCAQRRHSIERLLSEPVIQGIGKVSYSWYLWHWPMLILFPYIAGEALPWPRRVEVVFLSLGFAILSYHVVENPVRKLRRLNFEWVRTAAALAAVVVAISVIAANTTTTTGTGIAAQNISIGGSNGSKALTATLNAAAAIQKAPINLHPGVGKAAVDFPTDFRKGCLLNFSDKGLNPQCLYGDPKGTKTAVMFGDSHMEQWSPALNKLAAARHWKLYIWSRAACPAANTTVFAPLLKRTYFECDDWRTKTIDRILKLHPDRIFMGQSDDAPGPTMTPATWATTTGESVSDFTAAKIPVTFFMDTPLPARNIPECLAANLSTVSACTLKVSHAYTYPARRAASAKAAQDAGAKVFNPQNLLCGTTLCPVITGNILMFRDGGHMTATYASWISPLLSALIPTAKAHPKRKKATPTSMLRATPQPARTGA